MTQIPDPRGISLRDWADNVVLNFSGTGYVGQIDDNLRWQDWGAELILTVPEIASHSPPDPYSFSDWRAWGIALIRAMT